MGEKELPDDNHRIQDLYEQVSELNKVHKEQRDHIHARVDEKDRLITELRNEHHEQLQFIFKYIGPFVTALIIGLFSWAWNLNANVRHLETRFDNVDIHDRYKSSDAKKDFDRLRDWSKEHREMLISRVNRLEINMFNLIDSSQLRSTQPKGDSQKNRSD